MENVNEQIDKNWIGKVLSNEKRRKIIKFILLIGIPISCFLAFHNTKNEARATQKEFEDYKTKVPAIIPSFQLSNVSNNQGIITQGQNGNN